MPNKYSFYQLRIACQQRMLASLYVDAEDPEAFNAGFVEAVTPRHVLLWNITPWGVPDGWILRRTEDVLQVFMGDDYEVRMQMLLEMQGHVYAPLLNPAPGEEDDLMRRMLQLALETGEVVSIMNAEDTFTGHMRQLDDLRATIEVFDFFGVPDGERQFPLREMTLVAMGTSEEQMYRLLNSERLKLL